MDNKIDFTLPDQIADKASQLINNALQLLEPYLIALTPSERKRMIKMSDKTLPFVEKTCNYTTTDTRFIPPYMNVEQLDADFKAYQQLITLFRVVKQLANGLDDTAMQAGAESYTNALNYYNSVKQAAKMNVPGAKATYEDLSKRFAKNKADKEESSNVELSTE